MMEEEKKDENKAVSRAAEAYRLTAKKYLQISKHQANSIEKALKHYDNCKVVYRIVVQLLCIYLPR